MATFALELVSPEKLLLSRQVEQVVIPAAMGEMGILAGHAPMIVTLAGGTIRVTEDGKITESLFVSGGFAEVTPDRLTILADEATPLASLSKAEAAKRVAAAEAAYATPGVSPSQREAAMDALLSARVMAAVAEAE